MIPYALDSSIGKEITDPEKIETDIKKTIQAIAIASLSRGGFFKKAAFHGGTSLMMFHDLQRFSEDLDFMLIVPESKFNIERYYSYLYDDFNSFGFDVDITSHEKANRSDIQTAFIKGKTRELVLSLYSDSVSKKYQSTKNTIVKFEIDINPPDYSEHERITRTFPYNHTVTLCNLQTLFAGKIGAVLTRGWKNRVKGRDLFDFEYYVHKNIPYNQRFLASGLKRAGVISSEEEFTFELLIDLLINKFENLDYDLAKRDAIAFIYDKKTIDSWSPEHFKNLTKSIIEEGTFSINPEPTIRKRYPSYLLD